MEKVRANGLEFAYLTEGKGPLVLLLHGFPDTAHTWDRTMRDLAAAGFRSVAPFMRGYHPTEIPGDGKYDIETLGADAAAIIEALREGDEKAIVVGHDWGAVAAIAVAASRPDLVKKLITVAIPHPRPLKPTPGLVWKQRHFLVLRRKNAGATVRANNFAYVDELWRRWSPAWKSVPAEETAQVKAAFAQPGCAEAAAAYYKFVGTRPPPIFKKQITMPAIAFAGEHDVVSPRLFEKSRHCYDASYEVVIVPGGHFLHREHPDPFNSELVHALTK